MANGLGMGKEKAVYPESKGVIVASGSENAQAFMQQVQRWILLCEYLHWVSGRGERCCSIMLCPIFLQDYECDVPCSREFSFPHSSFQCFFFPLWVGRIDFSPFSSLAIWCPSGPPLFLHRPTRDRVHRQHSGNTGKDGSLGAWPLVYASDDQTLICLFLVDFLFLG